MKQITKNIILLPLSVAFGYLIAVGALIQAQNISAYWGYSLNEHMIWGWQFSLLIITASVSSSLVLTLFQCIVNIFTNKGTK